MTTKQTETIENVVQDIEQADDLPMVVDLGVIIHSDVPYWDMVNGE